MENECATSSDRDAGGDKSNLLLKASRSVSSLKASGSSQDCSFSNVSDSITPGDSFRSHPSSMAGGRDVSSAKRQHEKS